MANHDQIFKLMLQTLFREFLAAFAPEIHQALEPATIRFLDKELAFQAALDKIEDSKERRTVMELMTSWERKGRQEGRSATIKRQLLVLTGKLTPALERDLDRLTEVQLEELAEALLDFSNAKDLERWLAGRRVG